MSSYSPETLPLIFLLPVATVGCEISVEPRGRWACLNLRSKRQGLARTGLGCNISRAEKNSNPKGKKKIYHFFLQVISLLDPCLCVISEQQKCSRGGKFSPDWQAKTTGLAHVSSGHLMGAVNEIARA